MASKKVLLTGATGMLGRHVFSALQELGDVDIFTIGRSDQPALKNYITADISNIEEFSITLDELKPEYIIHCAAEVNVNLCETERERVYNLHVKTLEVIASKDFINKTVYISTDSVFDGKQGDYTENDTKNPLNYYALTKSLGEEALIKAKHRFAIIRTNIIGFSQPFKSSLFEWGYQNLLAAKPISGFSNIIFNPLYVKTLAEIVVSKVVFNDNCVGIYNFGAADFISKYEFLLKIADTFKLDKQLITPVEADTAGKNAMRPLNTTLNTDKAKKELGIKFPSMQSELLRIQEDLNHTLC